MPLQGMEFFSIFDGHRGAVLSQFAASEMPRLLYESLSMTVAEEVEDGVAMEIALRKAFYQCHEEAHSLALHGGTTALVLVRQNNICYCANAGDSRAVVQLADGEVRRLSFDHTADTIQEQERICEAGGSVEFGCLEGELSVCRGFGNFDMEGFTPEPYIAPRLNVEDADFVMLASDGLWDVVSDEQAASLVRNGLQGGLSADDCAQHLLDLACELNSCDDITVVIVLLHETL